MGNASSSGTTPRSKLGAAVVATLVVAGGGAALWNAASVRAAAKKIETTWKNLTTSLGFQSVFLEFEEPEWRTLADAEPGQVLEIPWLTTAFPNESFTATTTCVTNKDGITTWRGTLEDTLFGYSLMVASKAGVAGLVQRGETVYVVEPLPLEKMIITEISHKKLPPEDPVPAGKLVPEAAAVEAAMTEPLRPDYPIEVLLLLPNKSPRAGSYTQGPTKELVERLFESRLYDAYNKSFDHRLECDPRVTFNVTMEGVDYDPEGGKLGDDLDWLNTDPVKKLRSEAKADLVGLLVDVPKAPCKNGGVTYAPPAKSKFWYLTVEIHSALAAYSLEHEIGHCMGMYHNVEETAPDHCAFGHMTQQVGAGEEDRLVGRTIMMGSHGPSVPRVPVFSHPATDPRTGVRYGIPCGAAVEGASQDELGKYYGAPANNRRMILENAAAISHYAAGHPAD